MFDNSTIFITGATGTFGKGLIKYLVKKKYKIKKLIIYSRDELKQLELKNLYPQKKFPHFRFFIGDIRDEKRLISAMSGVDFVFHAAALKQVPAAEYNPFECIKTNILGAENVINAAIQNGVKRVIALSTDKASSPINLYGATKLCSDKLFIAANNYTGVKKIKFSVVRYGNVAFSRGSVMPLFVNQKHSGFFTITDKKMTRFNIELEFAIEFVIQSIERMWGGEIFIPKIPSFRITDLAKAINPKNKIKILGVRPGEKLHEEMISVHDSINTVQFKNYFVILPTLLDNWSLKNFLKKSSLIKNDIGKMVDSGFCYHSNTNSDFMTLEDIRKQINKFSNA